MKNKNMTQEIVFDKYADSYTTGLTNTLKISGFKPDYFHNYKAEVLFSYLKTKKLENKQINILDFGCGVGSSEPYLAKYLPQAKIFGCDISKESVNRAKQDNADIDNLTYGYFNGEKIPFRNKFDVIFVANVFHHIPRKNQQKTLNLLKSCLKKDGFLIIFEHNPYNPLTVLLALFTDYRYDVNTNLLAPFYMKKILKNAGFSKIERNYKIFFPGFAKAFIPYEKYLSKCPLGAHYYYIAS